MVHVDWDAPVGGTAALLACVPGLKESTVHVWQHRSQLRRRGDGGTGRAQIWHAEDVAEAAVRHEFSGHAILRGQPELIAWSIVKERLARRRYPPPGAVFDTALLFYREAPSGRVCCTRYSESAPPDFNAPEAPDTYVVLRIDRLIDRLAERIAAVAPQVVRERPVLRRTADGGAVWS